MHRKRVKQPTKSSEPGRDRHIQNADRQSGRQTDTDRQTDYRQTPDREVNRQAEIERGREGCGNCLMEGLSRAEWL